MQEPHIRTHQLESLLYHLRRLILRPDYWQIGVRQEHGHVNFVPEQWQREREREREGEREIGEGEREGERERESSDYTEFGGFFTRARFSLSHRSPLSQSKTQAIIEILGLRGIDNRIEVVKPVTPSCLFPRSPQIFSSGKEPITFFPSFRTNLIQVVKKLSKNFGIRFLSAPKATGPYLKSLSQENYP